MKDFFSTVNGREVLVTYTSTPGDRECGISAGAVVEGVLDLESNEPIELSKEDEERIQREAEEASDQFLVS